MLSVDFRRCVALAAAVKPPASMTLTNAVSSSMACDDWSAKRSSMFIIRRIVQPATGGDAGHHEDPARSGRAGGELQAQAARPRLLPPLLQRQALRGGCPASRARLPESPP